MARDGKGALDDDGSVTGRWGRRAPDAETRPLHPTPAATAAAAAAARGTAATDLDDPARITEVGDGHPVTRSPWPSSTGASWDGAAEAARYRIEATIGRGGMGEVLSARDDQIGRSVAIKRLRSPNAPAEIVARFLREARIQGQLDHPAIVPVHELWRDDRGQPFFVMKQLAGTTLAEVLARIARGDDEARRRYPRQLLLRAFVDVCLAIEFAHTRGIVHRDLKPANVMLGDFGEVYVLDWGVARVLAEGAEDVAARGSSAKLGDTVAGMVLGTPGYMSPEQIRGDADLDGRADVYALGCLLFEILAGEPLHPGGEAGLAEAEAGVDARPSVRAPEREVPPELEAVCVACTHIDRGRRLPTARAVGDAVQRYLDGDRDVATRAKLAASELEIARGALDAGGSIAHRRTAIRAAARALALDPSSLEAAELVARLMIEPPPEVPTEVDGELAVQDEHQLRTQSRLGALAMLAYFVFFPIMYAAGFRETWFVIAGPAVAALTFLVTLVLVKRPVMWLVYASFAGNALLVAILARVLSPFLVAPGLAVIIVMVYAMHPKVGRAWALWAVLVGAILVPWAAELAGVLSPTTFVADRELVLRVAAEQLDDQLITGGLALYTMVTLALAAALARALAVNRLRMQRSLHVQAWQLRQLVPRGGDVAGSFATMPRVTRFGSSL